MTQQWLSIVEYAQAYRMSDMTVRRRIKTGKLHAVLKEGKYFIPVDLGDARSSGSSTQAPQSPVHYPSSHGANAPQPQPRRLDREMAAVKGHPAAHRTFAQVPPHHEHRLPPLAVSHDPRQPVMATHHESRHQVIAPATSPHNDYDEMANDAAAIPNSLRRPLGAQETSLVDTRALLAYCDASLRKVTENERRTIEKFKSKLEALEATLAGRDQEIQTLRQKVEDLQLLITFIERK